MSEREAQILSHFYTATACEEVIMDLLDRGESPDSPWIVGLKNDAHEERCKARRLIKLGTDSAGH